MEKVELFAVTLALMLVLVPVSSAYGAYPKIGTSPERVSDSVYGIQLWDFNIEGYRMTEENRQIIFTLTMAVDVPVFPVVQVIDEKGYTLDVSFPQFSTSQAEAKELSDLIAKSEPVTIPNPTRQWPSYDFYTLNIMLFKDAEHTVTFDGIGYIVTMMAIGGESGANCYQNENWCLRMTELENELDRGVRTPPVGWTYDKEGSPKWKYHGTDRYISIMARQPDTPPVTPRGPTFTIQNVPPSLAFGQTIDAVINGQFLVATAILYHITAEGRVTVVSVDQTGTGDNTLTFPLPSQPQGRYQPGDYRLEVSVTDDEGNRFPYIYRWKI